jgi:hypothetical protein
MEWTIEYLEEARVVAFTTSGRMTLPSLCALVAAGIAATDLHRTNRVLVDHSHTISTLNTADIYEAPRRESDLGASRDTWVAIVRPAGSVAPDDPMFYENSAANSGLTRRMFGNRASALAWLAACPVPRL